MILLAISRFCQSKSLLGSDLLREVPVWNRAILILLSSIVQSIFVNYDTCSMMGSVTHFSLEKRLFFYPDRRHSYFDCSLPGSEIVSYDV